MLGQRHSQPTPTSWILMSCQWHRVLSGCSTQSRASPLHTVWSVTHATCLLFVFFVIFRSCFNWQGIPWYIVHNSTGDHINRLHIYFLFVSELTPVSVSLTYLWTHDLVLCNIYWYTCLLTQRKIIWSCLSWYCKCQSPHMFQPVEPFFFSFFTFFIQQVLHNGQALHSNICTGTCVHWRVAFID